MSSKRAESSLTPVVTRDEIRALVRTMQAADRRIGLVPTMGALHEGHFSLIRRAQSECDDVIVTIFVNPTQFGPGEDFRVYPRDLDRDLARLELIAVRHVFVPSAQVMYPEGFSTYVDPPAVARRWEGHCRPDHFRGVATIVLKLFNLIPAEIAFFGEKDYQQAQVIYRMITDLDLPTRICLCPTVRESDGLALSSRNKHLSQREREQAAGIPLAWQRARECYERGERDSSVLIHSMCEVLEAAGITHVDYVAVVNPETLEPVDRVQETAQVLIAARVGSTRLIDNIRLSPHPAA